MRKGKVKTYTLDENGNYKLYDENLDDTKLDVISPEELPKKIEESLHLNPFLSITNIQIQSNIESIEEFYIKYKNEELQLKDVIRDDSISKKVKKQLLKKQFKLWKNDAVITLTDVTMENEKQFLKSKPEKFKVIKSINIFYLVLTIVLTLFLIIDIFNFINKNILTGTIFASTLILSTISIVLTIIQKNKIKRYENNIQNHFQSIKKYSTKITKNIIKKYRKLKKYYSKNYHNNMFMKKPYEINKLVIDMNQFKKLKNDNNDILKDYELIIKENKGFNIYYHFPLFMSYFLMILNVGYIIIMLLIYLYKLIFMKGE